MNEEKKSDVSSSFTGGGREVVDKKEKNENQKAQTSKLEVAKVKILTSGVLKMGLLISCGGFFHPLLSAWNATVQI